MTDRISKIELKSRMLEIFRQLEANGEDLIVTDRGNPDLRVVPYDQKASVDEIFGSLRDRVIYHEDIDVPTIDEWLET